MGADKKVSDEHILKAWRESKGKTLVRLSICGDILSTHRNTIRRRLKLMGIEPCDSDKENSLEQNDLKKLAPEAARRIMSAIAPLTGNATELGSAIASGLVLADVIGRQRKDVDKLANTEAKISTYLSELLARPVNKKTMSEDTVHKAVQSYARLVDATAKRQDIERKAWGITEGGVTDDYGALLDQLDASEPVPAASVRTPPPVGTPPTQDIGGGQTAPRPHTQEVQNDLSGDSGDSVSQSPDSIDILMTEPVSQSLPDGWEEVFEDELDNLKKSKPEDIEDGEEVSKDD